MSVSYSLGFVLHWLLGLVGILALVPTLLWLIVGASTGTTSPSEVVVAAVVSILAVFGIWTRLWPNVKHRVRAGVLYSSFCTDAFPTTEEDLIKESIAAYERGNGKVTTVSHGWTFYLQKESAPGPRVWTTQFVGPASSPSQASPPLTWNSGTTLVQVKKAFVDQGLTIIDSPSMEWLSLGSWIASSSHGHPGTKSGSASPLAWVAQARVLDCETQQVTEDDEAMLFAKFHSGNADLTRYTILTVSFKREVLLKNIVVQRFATRLDTPAALDEWKRGQYMRLSFVSRHRRTLGIVWNTPTNNKVELSERYHMHPHTCSRFCFWNHSDVDSVLPCNCGGFAERNERYDGYAQLSEAYSGINPTFLPLQTMIPQLIGVYNTELFVPVTSTKLGDTNWLFELIIKLEDFHYTLGGRTELRIAPDSTVLFLDLSIRSIASMRRYRRVLFEYGLTKAAQHPGKWVSEDGIEPLEEKSVAAVFRSLEV